MNGESHDRTAPSLPGRERIYQRLLADLVEGRLPAGTRLVEATLAAKTGVSRTPMREALLRLEQEGFVEGERHKGYRVAQLDDRTARDIYPVVATLEALALRSAAPIVKIDLPLLRQANRALDATRSDPRAAMEADAAFHRLLLARCPNARLMQLIESLKRQLKRYESIYMSDAPLIELSVAQHEAIIAAIENDDFAAAAAALGDNYDSGLALVLSKLRSGIGKRAA
jgi:DNA-binding GntR family transcriptional regulator